MESNSSDDTSLLEQFNENIAFNQLIETLDYDRLQNQNIQDYFQIILNKSGPIEVDDLFILDSFATTLASGDKILEALWFFEQILKLNPYFLKSYQNVENIKNQLVERWHFRMLNDQYRNVSFKNSITNAILSGSKRILDIGTGTGLLSLYATKSLCSIEIQSCESSRVMQQIAQQVIKANNSVDQIKLINKYSTDLTAEQLNGRVDLIVTETLDCGAFGEKILQTLIHAKEYLLDSNNGRIIPNRIRLYVAGFESKTIAADNICLNMNFSDLIYLKNYRLVGKSTEPYDTENVRQIADFRIITSTEMAIECDFNNLDEMKNYLSGETEKKVRLAFERTGVLDGFLVWFTLTLDEANTIETKAAQNSCWDQTIFRLNHRFENHEKIKYLNLTVSCKDGMLNLNHYYDYSGKVFHVNPDVIRFINDTVYLNKLEFDFFATMKQRHSKKYENVLDFTPFPYIGISLMKEKRTKKLYCSKESRDFICFVAFNNCLQYENIHFINDPIEVLYIGEKFDLIILTPIDTLGCVNSSQISNYSILKANNLKPSGCMIPHKIELCAELISSKWLTHVTRVTNPELCELKIDQYINTYSTTHQLNLKYFPYEQLSNPCIITEIRLTDGFNETDVNVVLKKSNNLINGILYFYKIFITDGAEPIHTKRNGSHIRQACFVFDTIQCDNLVTTVNCIQNNGVIKCSLR